ncbi:unnamed protein product [Gongylonema pulchrum]|uniref:FH2 domain-containing protein n=1 Tax=Gongylonema pulchrum TaxID=637853 RepID=A0A183DVV3_9BILA|nr:unnamed protein product [Gongylonema pulchrum]
MNVSFVSSETEQQVDAIILSQKAESNKSYPEIEIIIFKKVPEMLLVLIALEISSALVHAQIRAELGAKVALKLPAQPRPRQVIPPPPPPPQIVPPPPPMPPLIVPPSPMPLVPPPPPPPPPPPIISPPPPPPPFMVSGTPFWDINDIPVLLDRFVSTPPDRIPPHALQRIQQFCRQFPAHSLCRKRSPAAAIPTVTITERFPPVPKIPQKSLLAGVPGSLASAVPQFAFEKLKDEERDALFKVCSEQIKCLEQEDASTTKRERIREHELAIARKFAAFKLFKLLAT